MGMWVKPWPGFHQPFPFSLPISIETPRSRFRQLDSSAGGSAQAVCSGAATAQAAAFRDARVDLGVFGSATVSPFMAGNIKSPAAQRVLHFSSIAGQPNNTAWEPGNYVGRINVTGANANITLTSMFVCRTNAAGTNQATVASITGQNISLAATGVKTIVAAGTAQVADAGDRIYWVFVFENASAAPQGFDFIPDQFLDTPVTVYLISHLSGEAQGFDPWTRRFLDRAAWPGAGAQQQVPLPTSPVTATALPSYTKVDLSQLFRPRAQIPVSDEAFIPPTGATGFYSRKDFRNNNQHYVFRTALNNFHALVDPTADDDVGDGYMPGSLWVNKVDGKAWQCTSSGPGAANWVQLG